GVRASPNGDGATAAFDVRFLRRTWRLLRILKAYPALLLIVLSVVNEFVNSKVGLVTGNFYRIFVSGQKGEFWTIWLQSAGIFLAKAAIQSTMDWLAEFLALRWRTTLSHKLQEQYCHDDNFYWLQSIDNPDQRIAQDLHALCTSLGLIAKKLAAAPFSVVWYSWLTYRATKSWRVVAATYVSFVVGFVILRFAISSIAALVYTQERLEGDYRAALLRLRIQGMEIAASKGGPTELQYLEQKLQKVLKKQGQVVSRRWLLDLLTKLQDYWGSLLNFTCVAVVVFSGRGADGTPDETAEFVSNISFYLLALINSLSQVLDTSSLMSNLAGLVPRAAQVMEELGSRDHAFANAPDGHHGDKGSMMPRKSVNVPEHAEFAMDSPSFRVRNLSCNTPAGEPVVSNLSFCLTEGESLLVVGSSGCGKSTLMACLQGLHPRDAGCVESPADMFLPQRPLAGPGLTLMEQLTYPGQDALSDEEISDLLRLVGLWGRSRRWPKGELEPLKDWSQILSPGELQCIGIARVLHRRPSVVILDESTSSLPPDVAVELYKVLKARVGIIISVGHQSDLRGLHDWVLEVHADGTGSWEMRRQSERQCTGACLLL
ncbi:unnamed protein product, partial [Ostreobium quekettii]